tara:strand:+ start:48 stop:230 length:183 start_codon:yes stop_codon:yes gene_type:complete
MQITSRRLGDIILEVTIETKDTTFTEDVCNWNGFIDLDFIDSLKELVEELELHNEQLKNK